MFGFSKRFGVAKSFMDHFPVRFYEGEEGAVGAAAAEAPAPEFVDGVPKEFMDAYMAADPSYGELIKKEKEFKEKPDADQTDKSTNDELSVGAENGEKDESTDVSADDSSSEDDSSFEFQDDIIEGLKGEHLKALPKEGKLALADFYSRHTEISERTKTLEARLEKLSADPVVRMREELIAKGQSQFPVREVTQVEKAALTQRLQTKLGVNAEEAELIFNEIEDHVKTTSSEMAEDILNNRVVEQDALKQADEITTKGRNIFLELGKMNKTLAFKETDANKFWAKAKDEKGNSVWVPNEKHPEFKKFSETFLPVMTALGESGLKYKEIVNIAEKFGVEAVYAMVAKKLNLPVAINTEKRDQKILKTELQKRLAPFMKSNTPKELTAAAGKDKPAPSSTIKHGYDIVKLATDPGYYNRAIDSKPNDLKHMQLMSQLAEEGDAHIRKTKK